MPTAAEITTIIANLTATYTTLSAEIASSTSMPAAQRSITLQKLADIRKELEHWENRLAQVNAGTGGRGYGIRFEAAP